MCVWPLKTNFGTFIKLVVQVSIGDKRCVFEHDFFCVIRSLASSQPVSLTPCLLAITRDVPDHSCFIVAKKTKIEGRLFLSRSSAYFIRFNHGLWNHTKKVMTNKTPIIIGQGHFLPFHVIMLLQADCIWNAVVIVHLFWCFLNIHSLYKITHIVDTMFKSVNTVSAYNKNLTTRVSTDWIIKNRLHLSGPSPKRGLQRWSRMWRMMHPCFRAQTLHFSFLPVFAVQRSPTKIARNVILMMLFQSTSGPNFRRHKNHLPIRFHRNLR